MKALAACIRADGVQVVERELVQTIAAILLWVFQVTASIQSNSESTELGN